MLKQKLSKICEPAQGVMLKFMTITIWLQPCNQVVQAVKDESCETTAGIGKGSTVFREAMSRALIDNI